MRSFYVSESLLFFKETYFIILRLFKYLPIFPSAIFMQSFSTFKYLIHLAFGKLGNLFFFKWEVTQIVICIYFFLDTFYSIDFSDHPANHNVID